MQIHFLCISLLFATAGMSYAAQEAFEQANRPPSEQIIEVPGLGDLAGLPAEIITAIGANLPKTDLLKFSLASKSVCISLMPVLKEHFPLVNWALGQIIYCARQNMHSDRVAALAFSGNGKIIASGSPDRTIKLWLTKSGQLMNTLFNKEGVNALAFSPADGNRLVSSGRDDRIKLWDIRTIEPLQTIGGEIGHLISSVGFTGDGKKVVFGGLGFIRFVDITTEKEFPTQQSGSNEFKIHEVGREYFEVDKIVEIKCQKNEKDGIDALGMVRHICPNILPSVYTYHFCFHPGYERASGARSSWCGPIKHEEFFKGICTRLAPNDKWLVAWCNGDDKSVIIVENKTGIQKLNGSSEVICLAFSFDSRLLAAASTDKIIKLFDLKTGMKIKSPVLNSSATSLEFSPDNKMLAAGLSNGSIARWQVQDS